MTILQECARPRPLATGRAGVTLVETLIAVALVGGAAVVLSAITSQWSQSKSSINLRSDRVALRQRLTSGVDCAQTLAPYQPVTSCPAFIPLRDQNGHIITAGTATGTAIGEWNVRAKCSAAGITVESAVFNPRSTTFAKDPFSGQLLSWTNPQSSLYPAGAGPCQYAFGASGPPGIILGGFVFHCPFVQTNPTSGYRKKTVYEMPDAFGSGTCPAGYVPRLSWSFPNIQCSLGAYGNCAWVPAGDSSSGSYMGCGINQFMCIKHADGSPVPPDGSGYD